MKPRKAKKVTIGRRVPTFSTMTRPGDYCADTIIDDGKTKRCVWFLLPTHEGVSVYDRPTRGSGLHCVTEPPWTFRDCADGSIEIRASIACGRHDPEGEYWHGFLDEGHRWREV